MATTEIEGSHGPTRDTNNISDKFHQVLHVVGSRDANKTITLDSALRYAHRVIARVNKEEENSEVNKRNTMTGTINILGLSHKRVKQCDPRLAWEMFHNIYHMYSDIKNKEETNEALLLTSMSDHEDINKVSKTTVDSHENRQNEFSLQVRTIFPPDLHQIQPRDTQVWKCDEIGLDPNYKWRKFVFTYKYF